MHLHELMGWVGPISHRQFGAWLVWLEMQWDRPSRSDQYMMQVAHEARHAFSEKKPPFDSRDYRLDFKNDKPPAPADKKKAIELATKAQKAVWAARLGIDPKALDKQSDK